MKKICCFGEILFRFSPDTESVWLQNNRLPFFIGGAELNVANALACWNVPVKYISAMPDHYLSRQIALSLQTKGIDISGMLYTGNRIGAYYLAQGADLKNAEVIYDRAHSSFSALVPGQVDWHKIFEDVSWFHFSAISPALNAMAAAVCKEALEIASSKNIIISVDLNYRQKLWQYGKEPIEIMPDLIQYCNVIMGNIWAAEKMMGIPVAVNLKREKSAFLDQAERTSAAISKAFPNCREVANTFRFDAEEMITYYATLFTADTLYVSGEHHTDNVVDKIGSGDCFMAGLIYGNYYDLPPQQVIDFATAAAFNKLFIKGDATTASVEEIRKAHL